MRDFSSNNTKVRGNQELSELFIGEDNTLSLYSNDEEVEVIGFGHAIFFEYLILKRK